MKRNEDIDPRELDGVGSVSLSRSASVVGTAPGVLGFPDVVVPGVVGWPDTGRTIRSIPGLVGGGAEGSVGADIIVDGDEGEARDRTGSKHAIRVCAVTVTALLSCLALILGSVQPLNLHGSTACSAAATCLG
jgi:hypothetical protein